MKNLKTLVFSKWCHSLKNKICKSKVIRFGFVLSIESIIKVSSKILSCIVQQKVDKNVVAFKNISLVRKKYLIVSLLKLDFCADLLLYFREILIFFFISHSKDRYLFNAFFICVVQLSQSINQSKNYRIIFFFHRVLLKLQYSLAYGGFISVQI